MPSNKEMMFMFTKAMLKWAGSGFKIVKRDEFIRRRIICKGCGDGIRCPDCGCFLHLKGALKTEDCPRGLWKSLPKKSS